MQSCQIIKTTMKTSLLQTLTPPKTIFWKLKECTEWEIKLKKGKLKEWTQTIKEWTKKSYLLKEKGVS